MITLDRIESLSDVFDGVTSQFSDISYKTPLGDFQHVLAQGEAEAFDQQREPGGTPWEPLKPSTIAKKGHSRILYETGTLMASLATVGGPGNISDIYDHGSAFGTDVEYAGFHQTGTSRMPARPPVGTNDETVDGFAEKIADFVVDQLQFKG